MRKRTASPGRAIRGGALALSAWVWLASASKVGAESPPANVSEAVLRDTRGATVVLAELARAHRLTVVIFYSATCPCFAAHVERLRQLVSDLAPQGIGFVVVDSERHANGDPPVPPEVGPGLPVLRDEGGTLARRLGATYATESYVLDPAAQVRYRGGVDSDRKYLRADAQPYLRQALAKLLGGNGPAFTTTKGLGCALRLL